ncbi:MAG: macro domain-containing protein, partial [Eubacterium sp.]
YHLRADYVIHTVGPSYSGKEEDKKMLGDCYWNSLVLAKAHHIHSIAFPAISTGVYGYPLEEAIEVAVTTVNKWLDTNKDYNISIIFSCFDQNTYDKFRAFVE